MPDLHADGEAGVVIDRPGIFFTWPELTRTGTGLPNDPSPEQARRLVVLCGAVLDPIRRQLGRPVRVNSGFRSRAVSIAVGGAIDGQHEHGEAADLGVDGYSHEGLVRAILGLPEVPDFDQLIWYAPEREGSVHISYACDRAQRGEILFAPAGGGYRAWSP